MSKNIETGGSYLPPDVGDLASWEDLIKKDADATATNDKHFNELFLALPEVGRFIETEATLIGHEVDILSDGIFSAEDVFGVTQGILDRLRQGPSLDESFLKATKQNMSLQNEARARRADKEQALAASLRDVAPASYISRALLEPHPVFDDRWHYVRAKIEVARQLFGVTDPNVTLGLPPGIDWQDRFHAEVMKTAQFIQLGHIMLSQNPIATAERFGKRAIIDELGMPQPYNHELAGYLIEACFPPEDPWSHNAMQLTTEIEPPAGGLLVDQIAS
jgi:hypothetical protein